MKQLAYVVTLFWTISCVSYNLYSYTNVNGNVWRNITNRYLRYVIERKYCKESTVGVTFIFLLIMKAGLQCLMHIHKLSSVHSGQAASFSHG